MGWDKLQTEDITAQRNNKVGTNLNTKKTTINNVFPTALGLNSTANEQPKVKTKTVNPK